MKWIVVALILGPLSIVVTFVALPLWRWIEAAFGVESIGHSGPAEWCYVATYAGLTFVAAVVLWLTTRTTDSAG